MKTNKTEQMITFSIDDGNLDDTFLENSSLSKNLDYANIMGENYYVLPKRDFNILLDFGDCNGFDIENIIDVISRKTK